MRFYPEIHAYTTHLDVGGDKIRTQARRLSTPSYAEGEWTDNSFKTQWRWSFEENLGKFYPFDTVHGYILYLSMVTLKIDS